MTNLLVHKTRNWAADMTWGIGSAAAFASAYSLYVLVLTVLRRGSYWPQYHATSWNIIGAYWTAAVIVGSILGVLRPWIDRRWGAGVAGFLTGAIVYSAIGLAMRLPVDWTMFSIVAIIGGLIGLGLGLVFYDDGHDDPIQPVRERHRIAVIIAAGVVLGFVIWVLCYPPMCLLGGRYCR